MNILITSELLFGHVSKIKSRIASNVADKKRVIAIVAPPVIIVVMYPIFNSLAGALVVDRIAWYIGLVIYWLIWCAIFSIIVIGKKGIKALISPQKPTVAVILPISIILLGALAARLFVPGMEYEKQNVWVLLLLLSTSFGNGFFEEVLWRGVYFTIFPNEIFYRMVWPTIWFALWHYVPGSVLHENMTGLIGLMAGSGLMGLVLSYMTMKTNTLWWSILAHTIGGIIMVV